ncbi:hypothetical protein D3C76_1290840 [compost metagenome]
MAIAAQSHGSSLMRFFFVNGHLCDVHHRQNGENKRLECPDKNTEALPDCQERYTYYSQLENYSDQNLTGKDIREQTNSQCNRLSQVFDDVERQENRKRLNVVLEIMLAVLLDAQEVHQYENDNRESGRNVDICCR